MRIAKLQIQDEDWRFFEVSEDQAEATWFRELLKRPELNERGRFYVQNQIQAVASRSKSTPKNTAGNIRDYGKHDDPSRVELWINFNAPGKDLVAEFESWLKDRKRFKEGRAGAPKSYRKKLKELAVLNLLTAARGDIAQAISHAGLNGVVIYGGNERLWSDAGKSITREIDQMNAGVDPETGSLFLL